MADRRRGRGGPPPPPDPETRAEAASELEGLRREIDALDVRIVALLNERAKLGLAVGHAKQAAGWSGVRDPRREREVLLRVTMANGGPLPQADLLAIYKRLIAATRGLEDRDRTVEHPAGDTADGGEAGPPAGPRAGAQAEAGETSLPES